MSVNCTDVDVPIVGAGSVGLALAVGLGQRGIHCLVVERNDRVGYSPRAKTTNVRTREHARRWGLSEALHCASPMALDYPSDVISVTRMSGPQLARFESAFNTSRARNNLHWEKAQWVPQYILEDVIRQHASLLRGVKISFNTELVSFIEATDNLSAEVKDLTSGETRQVESACSLHIDQK